MQLVPDWAPNIHPIIVHFPIAILFVAVFFNLLSLFIKKLTWLPKTTISLYIIGTFSAIMAFYSGREAADSLDLPSNVIKTLMNHADWAEYTIWYFGLFTSIYSAALLFGKKYLKKLNEYINPILFIAGFLGLYLVYQTGDNGAKMVYGYGLSTGTLLTEENTAEDIQGINPISENYGSTIKHSEDNSWNFLINDGSVETLKKEFNWIENNAEEISIQFFSNEVEPYIKLSTFSKSILLTYGELLNNIQIEARINIDSLDGVFIMIHHFKDRNNYDFTAVSENEITMGRILDTVSTTFERSKFNSKGWLEIKTISSGSHFRSYINNEMVVHGHGGEAEKGSMGFKIFGNSKVLISKLRVQSL